ncbi:MAG: carbon storage regulator [Pirellulales bacterium]|nr:carbon storage regulator [Pirellulales bacterium]
MLILSRKRDEQIVIGDGIIITVVSIRGGKVRIGIEAPSNVSVCRREAVHAHAEAVDGNPSSRAEDNGDDSPDGGGDRG